MNEKEIRILVHDLKQPLTPIMGYADMLLEKAKGEEKEYLERIKKSSEKLLKKLDELKTKLKE